MHFELLPGGGASPESMDIKSFVSCHRRRRLKAQFLLAGTRRRAGRTSRTIREDSWEKEFPDDGEEAC